MTAGGPSIGADGSAALAVTSSTGVMSVAIGRSTPDGPIDVASIDVPTERRHAEELGPRLRELLDRAGLGFADVELLVVDVGPGRFTGLRVGLATVRALAFALDRPVVGLTSLEILAAGATADGRTASTVTAVVDARRQEVFQQVFVDGASAGPALVGPPEELVADARGVVVGDGADRYREVYAGSSPSGAGLLLVEGRHPRALDMLRLAVDREPVPGTAIEPRYLRDPDAKANIRTRPQGVAT